MNELVTQSLQLADVSFLLSFKKILLTKVEVCWIDWIHEYIISYGKPPTLERFEKQFSHNFVSVPSNDPLGDIFDSTLAEKRNIYVRTEIQKHAQGLRDGQDPTAIINQIHEAVSGVDTSCVSSDVFDKSSYFRVPEIMLTGLPRLDEAIGGIVRGDLVYIAGRPGDGKTTLLLSMIAKWYWQGRKILLVSNEIRWDDMLFKVDAMLANMKIAEKRLGVWREDSKVKLRFLQYIQSISDGKIITPKGPVMKPSSVRALVSEHKPDVVCIDGAYLMSPNGAATNDWAELAAVSRELKQTANQENVPIIGVLQANRVSESNSIAGLGALAGTDSYGQDADIVMLLKAQGMVGGEKEVLLHTPKNRNGALAQVMVRYDFDGMGVYESNQ